jgi:hypothetical protein
VKRERAGVGGDFFGGQSRAREVGASSPAEVREGATDLRLPQRVSSTHGLQGLSAEGAGRQQHRYEIAKQLPHLVFVSRRCHVGVS